MPLTIKVNGVANSLVHKGSNGISAATLPDVCKTPSPGGPVPVPYPNVSQSATLAKGTTTVTADGGMMIANSGSEFSVSNGDEPGVAGGVKSGTFIKESTWITYSFDVKFEGKGACRLTDKKFQNHQNTVDMGGLAQAPVEVLPELAIICGLVCFCDLNPLPSASGDSSLKEKCVEAQLLLLDGLASGRSPIKPEIPYNMTTVPSPTPLVSRAGLQAGVLRKSDRLSTRMRQEGLKSARANKGIYQVRIPDAVITRTPDDVSLSSLTAPNLKAAVEIKFNKQARDPQQIRDYQSIVGGDPDRVVELSPEECKCTPLPPPVPVREPVAEQKPVRVRDLSRYRLISIPEEPGWWDRNVDAISKATGLTGTALAIYLIVSEGSRVLFPPRNLIPLP